MQDFRFLVALLKIQVLWGVTVAGRVVAIVADIYSVFIFKVRWSKRS